MAGTDKNLAAVLAKFRERQAKASTTLDEISKEREEKLKQKKAAKPAGG